jgi:anti-anti-sigma factor
MSKPAQPSTKVIKLNGMLVRSQVMPQLGSWEKAFGDFLNEQALAAAERPTELLVSLKGIERVDTSGLAVLLHAYRQATQHGVCLIFQDASPQLLALAQLCSLTKLLRLT